MGGGKHGKTFNFTGTYVSQGTKPHGSKWAMNPIPDFGSDPNRGPHPAVSFQPRCPESEACLKGDHGSAMDNPCQCSGEWGPYDLEIVDRVQLPSNLAAGEWVLGWRWDCEESNQVWTSCSDVSVVM